MRREELEHVIAAAANIVDEDDFVVVGSQAILGAYPDPPAELLYSMEADIFPRAARRKPSSSMETSGMARNSTGPTGTTHTVLAPRRHRLPPAGRSA
jgi:hypothetical protein